MRCLILFRHLAYAGKRLFARVTAETGAAASSVMARASPLGRWEGQRWRWTTIEWKDRSDLLGK